MAIYITKPWYGKSGGDGDIYGAEWTIGSSPAWTRTDAAVGFSDPNPYYSGMSGSPSSPFDNISPWKDLQIVTDTNAGTLVEIPKFYYKWTRTSGAMKLQISMKQHSGFLCSPAHADRGDNNGERDYVYVGRYHCASTYKSSTGVRPAGNIPRPNFRTYIHNLGSNVWQYDFAMHWTIMMLYLVEFAHWNAQAKIGYGCGNNSGTENMGSTDSMPYHTGTMKSSRTTYGVGIQYRNIEDLWANVFDWVDGIYFSDTNIYCIKNPANFAESTGGTMVGRRASNSGWIKTLTEPTVSGFEYALYPSDVGGSDGAYICDWSDFRANGNVLFTGSAYNQTPGLGPFFFGGDNNTTAAYATVGSRLMVLPPSRLTA